MTWIHPGGGFLIRDLGSSFTQLWNDSGSGADQNVGVWQTLNVPADFVDVGHFARDLGQGAPPATQRTLFVLATLSDPTLAQPPGGGGYTQQMGVGADTNAFFMRPNPFSIGPNTFRAMGDLIALNINSNVVASAWMLNQVYIVPSTDPDVHIWSHSPGGTGSLWEKTQFHTLQAYPNPTPTPVAAHYTLSKSIFNQMGPTPNNPPFLTIDSTDIAFDFIWNDIGTPAKVTEGSFWRPRPPPGYLPLGDYVKVNREDPSGTVEIKCVFLKDDKATYGSDLYALPTGHKLIYSDQGSGANLPLAVWEVQAPDGYFAMGHIATQGYLPPPLTSNVIVCVRADLLVKSEFSEFEVWTDEFSNASNDLSTWRISPYHTFLGDNTYGVAPLASVPRWDIFPLTRKIPCCMGTTPDACGNFTPQSSFCDQFMIKNCADTAYADPACACLDIITYTPKEIQVCFTVLYCT